MKIILVSTLTRLKLPGRNDRGVLINPELRDEVRLCYEICDERRRWITTPVGKCDAYGTYTEHPDEAAMRLKLQQSLESKRFTVVTYQLPDLQRVRFEAVRVFPCEVEVTV